MPPSQFFRVRPESKPSLENLGYRDFGDFFLPSHAEVVTEVRDRVVYRIPGDPGYYLKIFKNPGANRPWRQLASFDKPRSCAETEVQRLDWLEDRGFLGPKWMAWGAEMKGFSEARSFLLTEALAGRQGLDEWLSAAFAELEPRLFRDCKRCLLSSSARLLAKLHDEGFHHPFPYLRHFFVPEFRAHSHGSLEDGTIAMIDVHSAEIGGAVSRKKRARGLAELLVSSLKAPLSQSDRLYFLRAYGGGAIDRELAAATLVRFQQKLKRHPNRYAWAREVWEGMRFPKMTR